MTLAAALAVVLSLAASSPTDTPPPGPTIVTCTNGTHTLTAGIDDHLVATIVAATHGTTTTCTAPGMNAGGYEVGDHVWNGHHADEPTLAACRAIFPDSHRQQRNCVRVAACETGSLERGTEPTPSASNDLGRWQHNGAYVDARLAAIGEPDGDPYNLWTNARMTRWYVDRRGGSWSGSSGWSCGAKVGAP